jgi:hypothetical protein
MRADGRCRVTGRQSIAPEIPPSVVRDRRSRAKAWRTIAQLVPREGLESFFAASRIGQHRVRYRIPVIESTPNNPCGRI